MRDLVTGGKTPAPTALQGIDMFSWLRRKKEPSALLNDIGGMRLSEAEVDIMFIVKNNAVSYINGVSGHLFETVNRPWFSRHSPSSGNSVSHTLLETAA